MAPLHPADDEPLDGSELEFFGVKLTVKNQRLAALLNSDVTEDVEVVGRRARDASTGPEDFRARREVERRVLPAGDTVRLRPDGAEDV